MLPGSVTHLVVKVRQIVLYLQSLLSLFRLFTKPPLQETYKNCLYYIVFSLTGQCFYTVFTWIAAWSQADIQIFLLKGMGTASLSILDRCDDRFFYVSLSSDKKPVHQPQGYAADKVILPWLQEPVNYFISSSSLSISVFFPIIIIWSSERII